jgi:membrane protein implicated in regulation of membrane protease activity
MMSFVPLLTIILLIIAIVVKNMKTAVNKGGKYVYSTRIIWIVSGYIVLLLLSMGVEAILPAKAVSEEKIVDSKELDQESIDLYDAAIEGRIAETDRAFIRKEWNIDYEGETLTFASQNDEYLETQIVVERKQDNEGRIEATYYSTRSIVNNMDYTEKINPPGLELADDILMVSNPKKLKLKYIQFQNVFSVNQFTKEDTFFEHHTSYHGQSILYLRIPSNLELVDKSDINFLFVNS